MDEGAADRTVERPEHAQEEGGGTADGLGGVARQTSTAQAASVGAETSALLEDVLRRENLAKAYARVARNGTTQQRVQSWWRRFRDRIGRQG